MSALYPLLAGCFQAQLAGPVTNASISVATLDDPETVLMEARSWDEDFLSERLGAEVWESLSPFGRLLLQGIYEFEPALLPAENQWLLVSASGGRDVDRDGDGIEDEFSVLTAASWYGLVRTERLGSSGVLSNALADLLYRRVSKQLSRLDDEQIQVLLDGLAAAVLGPDANYEAVITWSGLYSEPPVLDESEWRSYIDALLNGQISSSIEQLALALLPARSDLGWASLPVGSSWQWQLQGELNTAYSVDFYDVDLFDTPVETISELQQQGSKVICYFSAGSYEEWRDDAGDFPLSALGATLDGWPGERWLDIRSELVWEVMASRLDVAMEKGCDVVEPDNIDGYSNESGFTLRSADQLAYNQYLATQAHLRGLAIGLKNDLDQVESLVGFFDFALNEQCHEYDECDLLAPFVTAGKAVFIAEYDDFYRGQGFSALCESSDKAGFSTLVLPLDLDDSFRLDCP